MIRAGQILVDRYFNEYLLVTAGMPGNVPMFVLVKGLGIKTLPSLKEQKHGSVFWSMRDLELDIEDGKLSIMDQQRDPNFVKGKLLDYALESREKAGKYFETLLHKDAILEDRSDEVMHAVQSLRFFFGLIQSDREVMAKLGNERTDSNSSET